LRPVDVRDQNALAQAFREAQPDCVLHAAALSRIDACYRDPESARRVNTEATATLAELCGAAGSRLVYVSTDLVFDGRRGWYREEDPPAAVSIYGATKAAGEGPVLATRRAAVVRCSLMFGPSLTGRSSFFDQQLRALRQATPMKLFGDEWRTPLGLPAAARILLSVAGSDFTGLLHLGGPERMSRWEMGQRLAVALGADGSLFPRCKQSDVPAPEPRPRDVSLDCQRFRRTFATESWPGWEAAFAEMNLRR
jgi:dTDP-4-dehydrorhamnose reductase